MIRHLPFIACLFLASASAKPSKTALIVSETEKITAGFRAWLQEKPRKTAVRFLKADDLPAALRDLGYRSAIVESGLVILISTETGAPVSEGVAIVIDGTDKSDLLRNSGWQVMDTERPDIKHLRRTETPSKPRPAAPGNTPNLRGVAF